jgi:hypothetical protein
MNSIIVILAGCLLNLFIHSVDSNMMLSSDAIQMSPCVTCQKISEKFIEVRTIRIFSHWLFVRPIDRLIHVLSCQ